MSRDYIEQHTGGFYVAGTGVSLDSVVYHFRNGASPETILDLFPALAALANVYGAIAFALDNRELVDSYLAEQERLWAVFAAKADPPPPQFIQRLNSGQPAH